MSGAVLITWNDSRRSQSLCANASLERVVIVARRRGWVRHAGGLLVTAAFLARRRPSLVWYQYSQALGMLLAFYRWVRPAGQVSLVADLHTKALRRTPRALRGPFMFFKRQALRACNGLLVTNRQNAAYARDTFGVEPLVLPDPLPTPPPQAHATGAGPVVFICSFAPDEPLELVLAVSRRIAAERAVVITGDPRHLEPAMRDALSSVATLSGFVPEAEYWNLLARAGCVVVLSTEPACLPCGAYEAIALGQRPVVADDAEARHVYGQAASYSALEEHALADAIRRTLADSRNGAAPGSYRERWSERWNQVRGELARRQSLPLPAAASEVRHAES